MTIFETHSFDDLSKIHGEARLNSYLPSDGDKTQAKADYLTNVITCQTFWRKIIFIEVAFRNKVMGEWAKIYEEKPYLKQTIETLTKNDFKNFDCFKNSLSFLKTKDVSGFNDFKNNRSNFIGQSEYIDHPLKEYFTCRLEKTMGFKILQKKLDVIGFIAKRISKQNNEAKNRSNDFKDHATFHPDYHKDILISRLDINFWVKMFNYISIEFSDTIDKRFKLYNKNYTAQPYFKGNWFYFDLLKIQCIRNNIAHHENILKGRKFDFYNKNSRKMEFETLGVKEIDDLLNRFCNEVVAWK